MAVDGSTHKTHSLHFAAGFVLPSIASIDTDSDTNWQLIKAASGSETGEMSVIICPAAAKWWKNGNYHIIWMLMYTLITLGYCCGPKMQVYRNIL